MPQYVSGNVTSVVGACVILHNICEEEGHVLLVEKSEQEDILVDSCDPSPAGEDTQASVDFDPNDRQYLAEKETRGMD